MSGTRIASISGLRGVVGDGLDPVVAVEFAAAYAACASLDQLSSVMMDAFRPTFFSPAVVAG